MPLMSSRMTCFYKRIFPVIWFGFLAVFFLLALIQGLAADSLAFLPFWSCRWCWQSSAINS